MNKTLALELCLLLVIVVSFILILQLNSKWNRKILVKSCSIESYSQPDYVWKYYYKKQDDKIYIDNITDSDWNNDLTNNCYIDTGEDKSVIHREQHKINDDLGPLVIPSNGSTKIRKKCPFTPQTPIINQFYVISGNTDRNSGDYSKLVINYDLGKTYMKNVSVTVEIEQLQSGFRTDSSRPNYGDYFFTWRKLVDVDTNSISGNVKTHNFETDASTQSHASITINIVTIYNYSNYFRFSMYATSHFPSLNETHNSPQTPVVYYQTTDSSAVIYQHGNAYQPEQPPLTQRTLSGYLKNPVMTSIPNNSDQLRYKFEIDATNVNTNGAYVTFIVDNSIHSQNEMFYLQDNVNLSFTTDYTLGEHTITVKIQNEAGEINFTHVFQATRP